MKISLFTIMVQLGCNLLTQSLYSIDALRALIAERDMCKEENLLFSSYPNVRKQFAYLKKKN